MNQKARTTMDEELRKILKYLRLGGLLAHWDELLAKARRGRFSHERLLRHVLEAEYRVKMENARLLRRKRAHIPEMLEIETFPFARQPKLDRKKIMSLYDRFDYMTKQQNIVWLGPTGCGKSGLATGFLLQALDRGYRGYFVTFPELLAELYASLADRSEEKVLRKYARYDCLVIDEVGYVEIEPAQVGLFFTLMQKRHKTKTTLITSNLGFSEWGTFLKNNHLTGALLDRLTETSHVINMKHCRSLRTKLDENGETTRNELRRSAPACRRRPRGAVGNRVALPRRGTRSARPAQMAHRTRPAVGLRPQVHELAAGPRRRRGDRPGDAPGRRRLPRRRWPGSNSTWRPARWPAANPPRTLLAKNPRLLESPAGCGCLSPTIACSAAYASISRDAVVLPPRSSSRSFSPASSTRTAGAMRSFCWWPERPSGRSARNCAAPGRGPGAGWPPAPARTWDTSGSVPRVPGKSSSASPRSTR